MYVSRKALADYRKELEKAAKERRKMLTPTQKVEQREELAKKIKEDAISEMALVIKEDPDLTKKETADRVRKIKKKADEELEKL